MEDLLGYWFAGMILYWLWLVFTTKPVTPKATCISTLLSVIWFFALPIQLWQNLQNGVNPNENY
jgi:hypothetical protein